MSVTYFIHIFNPRTFRNYFWAIGCNRALNVLGKMK